MIVYGKHSVCAALLNKKRHNEILYCTEKTQHLVPNPTKIKNKVKIKLTTSKFLDDLTQSTNHQGMALKTSRIFQEKLSQLFDITQNDTVHILILDHLEDPQNVGNIIRSAAAFNISAIILARHRSSKETPALIKAACGAAEIVPILVVSNIANIIKELKQENFWVLGLDGNAKENINKFKMPQKALSIIGSEQNGIQQLNKKNCDWLVKIPISSQVESLNAATAAGIIMNKFNDAYYTNN